MNSTLLDQEETLALVRCLPTALEPFREMLLANLVMIGEVPAPTFGEDRRIEFLQQRFTEGGLQNCSADEVGNGFGILPGRVDGRSILVVAHADTPFSAKVNHELAVTPARVIGPGVADNSLGLAVLATLPTVLERLDIHLRSDLVLMGAARSLGRGDLGGLRFFLANNELPLAAAVSVEGVQLGRLNYASLASLSGEITCKASTDALGSGEGPQGAIIILNAVIDRLFGLPLAGEPGTELVLGSVEGGTSFKTPARSAVLRFEVRGESDEVLADIEHSITSIVEEVAVEYRAAVNFEVIARSRSGGLDPDHLLVLQCRRIMAALGIQPLSQPYSSAISSLVERDIPGVTIGITDGYDINEPHECVAIEPILRGLAQLIGVLLAIDGGCCDGH